MTKDGSAPAPTDLVELGAVRGPYGLKGEVRIQPFDADASVLRSTTRWWLVSKGSTQAVDVLGVRPYGDVLLARWRDWTVPESVEALKGARVAVSRSAFPALPDGEYYWTDLIGSTVLNREGEQLGRVTGLSNNGAQDLLSIEGEYGPLLVPLVPAYVDKVDVQAREVRVDWQVDWS